MQNNHFSNLFIWWKLFVIFLQHGSKKGLSCTYVIFTNKNYAKYEEKTIIPKSREADAPKRKWFS